MWSGSSSVSGPKEQFCFFYISLLRHLETGKVTLISPSLRIKYMRYTCNFGPELSGEDFSRENLEG